eukprot:5214197-Pyramimonas_sp.AAC.1
MRKELAVLNRALAVGRVSAPHAHTRSPTCAHTHPAVVVRVQARRGCRVHRCKYRVSTRPGPHCRLRHSLLLRGRSLLSICVCASLTLVARRSGVQLSASALPRR